MTVDAICEECGYVFKASEGPSMSHALFHCERCGREKWIEHVQIWKASGTDRARPCRCGGEFRVDARARCPKCRSTDWEADPTGEIVMYD